LTSAVQAIRKKAWRGTAQTAVCADAAKLVFATKLLATTADAPTFAATILATERTIELPKCRRPSLTTQFAR
jgi:hypothetical protein